MVPVLKLLNLRLATKVPDECFPVATENLSFPYKVTNKERPNVDNEFRLPYRKGQVTRSHTPYYHYPLLRMQPRIQPLIHDPT